MVSIPVGRLTVATPETMAESVNNPTVARDAVDARVLAVAADVIAGSEIVEAAAAEAVDSKLASENIVRAYPEEPLPYTGRRTLPMQWVARNLNDPVGDTVSDTISGTWVGTAAFRGDIPTLTESGKLDAGQIPDSFATRDYVDAAVAGVTPQPGPVGTAERVVRGAFPILAARVAAARVLGGPLAAVFTGSSTTEANPGYVARMVSLLQSVYPVAVPSVPQWSNSATFTARTTPGLHGYSAGQSGKMAEDFLTDEECDRVAALTPGAVLIMVGANDYWRSVDPATYKSQLVSRLAYLDAQMTLPCQYILVHAYPRAGEPGPTRYLYPWEDYRAALSDIAASRSDSVLVDVTGEYEAVGVGVTNRPDPLGLMGPDDTHQSPTGYRFLADLLAGYTIA